MDDILSGQDVLVKITEKGAQAGLFIGTRISQKGTEYPDIYYDEQAQMMIVEHYQND